MGAQILGSKTGRKTTTRGESHPKVQQPKPRHFVFPKLISISLRFINGFITRNGPVTEDNKAFLEMAKSEWLRRLAKNLPTSLLDRKWPVAPHVCQEASAFLETYYGAHLSRVYRFNLTPERKEQLELKILAEKLFAGVYMRGQIMWRFVSGCFVFVIREEKELQSQYSRMVRQK